ncbi:MAG: helix-turn-helix domain-containing protein [Ruminiclostridium sp.]|nr:helix-turn-helix domain-containing protein [Ruminiclostridium sp.]
MLDKYPEIITVDDLCEILHISQNKAYEILRLGLIKSLRVGRKYIIPKTCVINFVNQIANNINLNPFD